MPIYEYRATRSTRACSHCRTAFETLQGIREEPLKACPKCGGPVKRIISRCRFAVVESSDRNRQVESKIRDYEASGMWSHAAELADKHSEKIKDKGLKTRALDNYKKAGYDVDTLLKHADAIND
ncbi:MAG: zinc ribbon domain-containing protein [Deltaproteobacteria bacterium]|nr:zinc ribbon domain-containing protein [Deltaproteobacteria bacterium]